MGEGREGDWECGGCRNRNYAFRSFCNRCKQPRLFMDSKTPPDSKWLPRIGDWICTGCTNNNYASREKCKKCGQPKAVAAMPAIAMPGASFPTHPHWFARVPGPFDQPVSASKGWRNGDWICGCGFHNYSSRLQCKKCNASSPPALGTKRLASEDLVHEWEDNKRLNHGYTHGQPQPGAYASYPGVTSGLPSDWPAPLPFLHHVTAPALLGKGAKQWRSGDWMCTNCNNHNYASRSECNRCKTQRDMASQPATLA